MFSKYFISTLVFIIVSLVVLFQGEIKEGFSSEFSPSEAHLSDTTQKQLWDAPYSPMPNVYGRLPVDGMVGKPFFGGWQGTGAQFMAVDATPLFDKYGAPIKKVNRKLGYDKAIPKTSSSALPKLVKSSQLPVAGTFRNPIKQPNMVGDTIRERYTPVSSFGPSSKFDSVQIEATRNMQPLTGGPPRFNNNQSPHLNLTYPIDNEKYAVDPLNPIVNYGCGDVYSDDGQLQKMPLSASQDVYEGYTGGINAVGKTSRAGNVPNNMISMNGQPAQPFVIDRVAHPALMVNSKSRLQLGGVDRIRGDLEIVPWPYNNGGKGGDCGNRRSDELSSWFQVSVKPHRDLVSGYIPEHNKRNQFFGAHIAASGVETDLMDYELTMIDPESYAAPVPTFGPDGTGNTMEAFDMRNSNNSSTMGRSNATSVRYGTDINVGSYGN